MPQTSNHAHEEMGDTVQFCNKCDPFDKKNGLQEFKKEEKKKSEEGGVREAFQPVLGTWTV